LGLLICRDICEAIEATLSLDNAFPVGLVVSVTMPLAEPRRARTQPPVSVF
jgi:signal transduction histidine kinase